MSLSLRSSRARQFDGRGDRSTRIDSKIIVFVVKLTFVTLLCGSSYLAGSIWGRHSLEMSSVAPMSVGSLIHGPGGAFGDSDLGVDCEKVRRELINSEVKKGEAVYRFDSMLPRLVSFLICMLSA